MLYRKAKRALKKKANKERSKINARFFKTGVGQYGAGDQFMGITVSDLRRVARDYSYLTFTDIQKFLKSKFHEERMFALIVLGNQYEKAEQKMKKTIYKLYLKNIAYINNWDLVDMSSAKIVGAYVSDKPKRILRKLTRSRNMWERRIAITATYYLIKHGNVEETFKISKMLLTDDHDLIHKAVGWMLREAGKKNVKKLEEFLKKYYKSMPRTTLRYAIERFSEKKRKSYLQGKI